MLGVRFMDGTRRFAPGVTVEPHVSPVSHLHVIQVSYIVAQSVYPLDTTVDTVQLAWLPSESAEAVL